MHTTQIHTRMCVRVVGIAGAPITKNPPPIELIYKQVELDGSSVPALDRAFDILFDEVLRRRELNTKAC